MGRRKGRNGGRKGATLNNKRGCGRLITGKAVPAIPMKDGESVCLDGGVGHRGWRGAS